MFVPWAFPRGMIEMYQWTAIEEATMSKLYPVPAAFAADARINKEKYAEM